MAYDPDFAEKTAQTFGKLGFPPNRPPPRFPRGDIASRRQGVLFIQAVLALDQEEYTDVEKAEYWIPGYQQAEILLTSYRKKRRDSSIAEPAILYMHGGGMIFGSTKLFEPMLRSDVRSTGVTHFSIDYRLAPEFKHPTPVEDCYAALLWLSAHASELGVDSTRIGVAGLSAGGGLAAAVALLARDRGLTPPIAKQLLFCPMLDDRNIAANLALLPLVSWSWDDNWTGWNALLGDQAGSTFVSEYAAPARSRDFQKLPPTYIDVGSLDIFVEEDQDYADRLRAAGVAVEWHLYEGIPHGFELRGLGSKILREAQMNRRAAIRDLWSVDNVSKQEVSNKTSEYGNL